MTATQAKGRALPGLDGLCAPAQALLDIPSAVPERRGRATIRSRDNPSGGGFSTFGGSTRSQHQWDTENGPWICWRVCTHSSHLFLPPGSTRGPAFQPGLERFPWLQLQVFPLSASSESVVWNFAKVGRVRHPHPQHFQLGQVCREHDMGNEHAHSLCVRHELCSTLRSSFTLKHGATRCCRNCVWDV